MSLIHKKMKMKKSLMILGVAALFAGTTSCKKDFVCECNDGGLSYTITFKESKKAAAAAMCEGTGIGSIEYNFGGVTTTAPSDSTGCSLQ